MGNGIAFRLIRTRYTVYTVANTRNEIVRNKIFKFDFENEIKSKIIKYLPISFVFWEGLKLVNSTQWVTLKTENHKFVSPTGENRNKMLNSK